MASKRRVAVFIDQHAENLIEYAERVQPHRSVVACQQGLFERAVFAATGDGGFFKKRADSVNSGLPVDEVVQQKFRLQIFLDLRRWRYRRQGLTGDQPASQNGKEQGLRTTLNPARVGARQAQSCADQSMKGKVRSDQRLLSSSSVTCLILLTSSLASGISPSSSCLLAWNRDRLVFHAFIACS